MVSRSLKGKRNGEQPLMGMGFLYGVMNALGFDTGDGCTTLNTLKTTESHFMICEL